MKLNIKNSLIDILYDAKSQGVLLRVEEGRIKMKVKKGIEVPKNFIAYIKENKDAIIELLTSSQSTTTTENIIVKSETEEIPLSFAQQSVWIIDNLGEGSVQYHLPAVINIKGNLHKNHLETSFKKIVERHQVLRTIIKEKNDTAVAEIISSDNFSITIDATNQEDEKEIINKEIAKPFNLSKDYMIRVRLLELSAENFILIVVMHHIASDGWSIPILINELETYYQSLLNESHITLPELSIQYGDYARWQRKNFSNDQWSTQMEYWSHQLKNYENLELPYDHIRPSIQSFKGEELVFYLKTERFEKLKKVASEQQTTFYVTLLSVFKILLSRLSGQDDLCVATPVANRKQAQVAGLIGFFANTIVLRSKANKLLKFSEFLNKIKETVISGFDNQEAPFEKVVDMIVTNRSLDRNPLAQVLFSYANQSEYASVTLGNTEVEIEEILQKTSKFDLSMDVIEQKDEIKISIIYNPELFTSSTINRISTYYVRMLDQIVSDSEILVKDIRLLDASERNALLPTSDAFSLEEEASLALYLEEIFNQYNDKEALCDADGRSMNYEELWSQSGKVSNYLAAKYGLKQGDTVVLYSDRSMEMVVLFLALTRLGCVYVPVDTIHPEERLRYITKDSSSCLLIVEDDTNIKIENTQTVGLSEVLEASSKVEENLITEKPIPLDATLYIIYTSGSTGMPKGVCVSQGNLLGYLKGIEDEFGNSRTQPVLSSHGFDIFFFELLSPLLKGGTSILLKNEEVRDMDTLESALQKSTSFHAVPALMGAVLDHIEQTNTKEAFTKIEELYVGGDVVSGALLRKMQSVFPQARIYVFYGPTEGTIFVTSKLYKPNSNVGDSLALGKNLRSSQVLVLDRYNNLVAPGVKGELCIGGVQVSKGYLHNEELTAEKYINNPYGEGQLYRTGDLARWDAEGNIEYLGREDSQIKLRGYRIELGEITRVVENYPNIAQAVVIKGEIGTSEHLLCYYRSDSETIDENKLKAYLSGQLPNYMVPSYYKQLEHFALTSNGKLDRKQLPEITITSQEGIQQAQTKDEKAMVAIWEGLLGVRPIGIDTNFFELGGDSIKAIQLMSRSKQQGYHFKVKDVFKHPTIGGLLSVCGESETLLIETGLLEGDFELLPIQHRFMEHNHKVPNHYNQSVLLSIPKDFSNDILKSSIAKLVEHHDILRSSYKDGQGFYHQEITEYYKEETASDENTLTGFCQEYQESFDIVNGPLIRFIKISYPSDTKDRLFIVAHHLVIDGVSWRIILEDLEHLLSNQNYTLPEKQSSLRQWSKGLAEYTSSLSEGVKEYWQEISKDYKVLKDLNNNPLSGKLETHSNTLNKEITKSLSQEIHGKYGTELQDVLLSCLSQVLGSHYNSSQICIDLEGHGREEIISELDISRTIGWFTSLYPLKLQVSQAIGVQLRDTKDMLKEVPDGGLSYGALRYLSDNTQKYEYSKGGILFNYLGDFSSTVAEEGLLGFAGESTGDNIHPSNSEGYGLLLTFMIAGGELQMNWSYDEGMYSKSEIATLSALYQTALTEVIADCKDTTARILSCSDCGLPSSVGNIALDEFIKTCETKYGAIESVYRLSPLQEGMLFHSLYGGEGSGSYVSEFVCDFNGGINYEVFKSVWESIIARHGILRTGIYSEGLSHAVQCVYKSVDLPITHYNYTDKDEKWLSNYFADKALVSFDMESAPLFSFELYDLPGGITRLYLYNHHILWDGWSLSILMNEFIQGYDTALEGATIEQGYVSDYGAYVRDLYDRDRSGEGINYWQEYLSGVEGGVYLPFLKDTSLRNSVFGDSHVSFELDTSHTNLLVKYSQTHGLTMNTLVQGAWSYLLHSYTGAEKIVFGATVSGRDWSVGSVEQEVGLYINTLPVSIEIDRDQDLGDWLSDLQAGHSKGREQYSHVSLSMIQEAMGVNEALFDSLIVFDNYPMESVIEEAKSKLQVSNMVPKLYNNYALTIGVSHTGDRLHFKLDYNKKVFPKEYIDLIVSHLQNLLFSMSNGVAKVGALSYIGESDKNLQLGVGTKVALEDSTTIVSLFEAQVKKTPNAVALEYRNKELTYQEVNHQANQLATYLIQNFSINSGDVVSVLLPRSSNSIIAIMGILKAGAAYLPIDTEYPDTRINYMLENSASKCVITYPELATKIEHTKILDWDTIDLTKNKKEEKIIHKGDSLAYIIYTSGSTGEPKGVMISHKSIANYICWAEDHYLEKNQAYNFPLYSSLSFDLTLTSIFLPLISGNKILIYPDSKTVLTDWVLTDDRINIIKLTPSHLRMIKDYQSQETEKVLSGLQKVIVGGEKLESNLAFEVSKLFDHTIDIFNEYGPTEATVGCSCYTYDYEKDQDTDEISIGIPIANTRLYVLNDNLEKVATGVWGELCVSGVGLSRGYIGKESLTAEKFIANPYEAGQKMYRTGDICRWNTSGELEFKGRKDTQVKLRGYRIELGEIESVVSLQENISQSVVVLYGEGEVQDLACYVVLNKNTSLDIEKLKVSLTEALPEYMVPTHYMELEELPLTINGKVDKKRLPAIELGSSEGESDFTEQELLIRSIWSDVLEIDEDRIFKGDSFFDLGGNSLSAISLINKLSKDLEVKVPLDEVFSTPTLAGLSAFIESSVKSSHSSIPILGEKEFYALSSAQRRMYFLYEFNRDSITYNMPNIVILRGELNVTRFENTIKALIARHESLRTYFEMQGDEVYQKILPKELVDFSVAHYQGDALESEKVHAIIEDFIRPFDLSQAPLLRVGLIQITGEEHILMLDMHHIITDGVSQGILVRDFMELYKDDSSLKELDVRYVDYSDWQQKEGIVAKSKEYWMNVYNDIPEVLDIPTDYPRGSVRDEGGSSVVFELDNKQVAGLKKLSESYGITLYMLLLGIYKIVLSKLSGQEDIVVGTPVAGRGHSDVEGIVGLFVNTLALRTNVSSNKSFKSYIKDLGEDVINSFEHQDFQYEELVNLLEIERDTSRNALFDVMFSFESMGDRSVEIPGLVLEPYERNTTISKFDLDLSVFEDGEGNLQLSFEYATSLYNRSTIERYSNYYLQILTTILANPSQKIAELEILSTQERNILLNEFNKTEKEYDIDISIIELFEKQALQTPEQIAIVDNENQISYNQLLNNVHKVAGYLSEKHHIQQGNRVAIQMNRGSNAITTILAILKLGAVYIPVDPTLPQVRINHILKNSTSELLIIEDENIETTIEGVKIVHLSQIKNTNTIPLKTPRGGNSLAYIIYTSGSTGAPKGVMIENRSLVNLSKHMIDFYDISEKDKVLQFAPLHFDMSVEEIFPALISGATLYIRNDEILASSSNFLNACKNWELTILNLPTAFWNYLYAGMKSDDSQLPDSVKILAVGGEALHLETTKKWVQTYGTMPQLVNAYGPTEVTVNTCMVKLNEEILNKNQLNQVPIGTAISNHTIYILNKDQQLMPIGSIGEICVSGPGVAKGYVAMETLTNQKFIQNPFGEGKLYRTGDMGRWISDGSIEFIGRKDNQVKIRGHRIETGDIESHIVMMDAVKECVVTVKEIGGDKTLVAYYTSRTSVDENKIQEFLAQKLPEYMVPAYFCEIANIPWKTNGKVDKKQLPEIVFKNKENYVAPTNTIEKEITQIWAEILDIEKDQISILSDFFRIGGHSLKAMSFINKTENTFDVKISLRDFFMKPTIKQVAVSIELAQWLNNKNKKETTKKKIIKI